MIDFKEKAIEYLNLEKKLNEALISEDQFLAEIAKLTGQDEKGNNWAVSREGNWLLLVGQEWIVKAKIKHPDETETGKDLNNMQYVVKEVVLKKQDFSSGSRNMAELENVINIQASKGYRLHTISTASSGSQGLLGAERIQATLVFEKL